MRARIEWLLNCKLLQFVSASIPLFSSCGFQQGANFTYKVYEPSFPDKTPLSSLPPNLTLWPHSVHLPYRIFL